MTTLTTAWFLSESIHQAASLHGSAGGHGACLDGPFHSPLYVLFFFTCKNVHLHFCVFFMKRGTEEGLNAYVRACVSPRSARPGPRSQSWWNATLRSPGGDATQLNGSTFVPPQFPPACSTCLTHFLPPPPLRRRRNAVRPRLWRFGSGKYEWCFMVRINTYLGFLNRSSAVWDVATCSSLVPGVRTQWRSAGVFTQVLNVPECSALYFQINQHFIST